MPTPKFKWGDFDEGAEEMGIPAEAVSPMQQQQQVSEVQEQDEDQEEEKEQGKERFRQRLWCYLFENLSRAIDELYFMCELECDVEQTRDALLVFNEAALDFSDLQARIEGFDKLRQQQAPPSKQRPHAIAWEVRRMASSPRRADILSMSLDAFKSVRQAAKQDSPRQSKRRDTARFLNFDYCVPKAAGAGAAAQVQRAEGAGQPPLTPQGDGRARPKEGRNGWEAWKEKRNWEDILSSPIVSTTLSSSSTRSPAIGRKSTDRGRVLHDKLMSPERKKKSPMEMKKEVDEKQERATRIRRELENERALRLQRVTEKLNRVSEWQAVKSTKLREGMNARQQRGESRHEAHLAQIARRASDESNKVSEVRFITSLNEENKKLSLQQKLQDSEVRRAERLQNLRVKQKEDMAREEAALERRKLLEAERLQRIAETQRKKEEAQARREEERKAANAAREARAVEQVRKKEVRAKAQEEEVELLRQRLAERLRESSIRRKVYLEQIRERAVMEPKEQGSSPLSKRPCSRDGVVVQLRNAGAAAYDMDIADLNSAGKLASPGACTDKQHQTSKKRIKKLRQRLAARSSDLVEFSSSEVTSTIPVAVKTRLSRWAQDIGRCQGGIRKAGPSAALGSTLSEMLKYFEDKELELHAARQTSLLESLVTAMPPPSSKQDASQASVALLRVMLVLLREPGNRGYFLLRNLVLPLIPALSASLDNYSTVGCPGAAGAKETEAFSGSSGEVLVELLKCVTLVTGHAPCDERQLQMQDDLVELVVAYDIVHRLRNLFAVFDRPHVEGAPFPPPVLLGLKLLETLTRRKLGKSHWLKELPRDVPSSCERLYERGCSQSELKRRMYNGNSNHSVGFLIVSISETRLVGLPSLLTAVLLQANPKSSPEQACLPSNFEEVATSVLRVLNSTARLDLSLVQTMLAMPDLKMEFFHLVSFLLSYCTCKWRAPGDKVASLLLETLLLLGYFSLLHPGNQAVLRWGKSPTILHKLCELPFAFFSDAELIPVLVGTLLAACYGCERNRDVIQQEMSTDILVSPLRRDHEQHQQQLEKATVEEEEAAAAAAEEGRDRFKLENRFPIGLWNNAINFFSAG